MESYHNEKIRDVFKKDLIEEPLAGWESIFQLMVEKKMIKPVNPRIMAYEYWSFVIFLLFDYSILYYEQDFGSYMKGGLEKMNNHTRLLLEAVKRRDKQSQLKF